MHKLSFIILLAVVVFTHPATVGYADGEIEIVETQSTEQTFESEIDYMKHLVDTYADKHGVSRSVMHAVVKCESTYNPKAVNMADKHRLSVGSHGISQFSKQTFESFASKMGASYTDPYNPDEALDVMGYMIAKGHGRHWTCFRNL